MDQNDRLRGGPKGPEARWNDVRPPMEKRNEGEDAPAAGGGTYSAEASRQGYIVLRSPARRRIFVGGLIALVLVVIALGFLF